MSYGITLATAAVVAYVYPEWRGLYAVVGTLVVIGVVLRLRSRVTLTPEGLAAG